MVHWVLNLAQLPRIRIAQISLESFTSLPNFHKLPQNSYFRDEQNLYCISFKIAVYFKLLWLSKLPKFYLKLNRVTTLIFSSKIVQNTCIWKDQLYLFQSGFQHFKKSNFLNIFQILLASSTGRFLTKARNEDSRNSLTIKTSKGHLRYRFS